MSQQTKKKQLLPSVDSSHLFQFANQTELSEQQKKKFTLKYYNSKPWYKSIIGICFVIVVTLLFLYGVIVLSIVNSILYEGSSLTSSEFKNTYGVARGDLHNLQTIFTIIVVLTSIVMFGMLLQIMPDSLKSKLFNKYTVILFILFMFIISCWVQSSIASKDFSNVTVNIINLIILIVTVLFIFAFLVMTINHHYEFIK